MHVGCDGDAGSWAHALVVGIISIRILGIPENWIDHPKTKTGIFLVVSDSNSM
jgi:hypothetical protein